MPIFRKYKLNRDTLMYENQEPRKWEIHMKRIFSALLIVGLAVLYCWLYVSVLKFELPKTAFLKKRNAQYQEQLLLLSRQMDLCESSLSEIEDRDDGVYRAVFGMNKIPYEQRMAGFEGENRYAYLDDQGASPSLKRAVKRMDTLMVRISVESASLTQMELLSSQAGDMASCLPAVPPILPEKGSYRISSSFGGRQDPVYGGWRFHEGIDLAGKKGMPIYATGDGVVEKASFHFYGYGNEIVIDHGYGYKTRYAHLNTILVAQGAKVHRGEQIGELGNSGKSTGPHLHYEVIYKGARVNPYNYFDLTMPVEEYRAMIQRQQDESEAGKRTSTGDLVRRVTQ